MESEGLPTQELSSSLDKPYQTDLNTSEDELQFTNNEADGEEEAAWLSEVGLASLVSVVLEQGQLIQSAVLHQVAEEQGMTRKQLKAVKKRIDVLNSTLKARKGRITTQKRPDCRDIFRDHELSSTGGSSRSRSATPDSLDADSAKDSSTENLLLAPEWGRPRTPGSRKTSGSSQRSTDSVADIISQLEMVSTEESYSPKSFDQLLNQDFSVGQSSPDYKYPLIATNLNQGHRRRSSLTEEPSHKFRGKFSETESKLWLGKSVFSIFDATGDGHVAVDKGIEVLRYQQVGTLSAKTSYAVRQKRSGSDPTTAWISPVNDPKAPSTTKQARSYDDLSSGEVRRLRQLALLEATALFDEHGLKLRTKKAAKKQSRNKSSSSSQRQVFGLPLIKLLHRDAAVEATCKEPRIFSTILRILEKNFLDEEGILRVSGSRQKILSLQKLIDSQWYANPTSVENSLMNSLAHDLAGVLKLFLRMLPESVLTNEYLDAFLQVDGLLDEKEKVRALNLLCALLPAENRRTLSVLLKFLNRVAENQSKNRMSVSNLATVISPNLFFSKNSSKPVQKSALSEELALIAQSNRITFLLISNREEIFALPSSLVNQLSQQK